MTDWHEFDLPGLGRHRIREDTAGDNLYVSRTAPHADANLREMLFVQRCLEREVVTGEGEGTGAFRKLKSEEFEQLRGHQIDRIRLESVAAKPAEQRLEQLLTMLIFECANQSIVVPPDVAEWFATLMPAAEEGDSPKA